MIGIWHIRYFFFIFYPAIIWTWLETLRMYIFWCRTDIWSCKFSAKVSLVLVISFPVPSLCKLNHISVCFIQISTKITYKQLIPFRENMFFWSDPWCFGPLGKFQHKWEISIRTARVSRLSFCFLWPRSKSGNIKTNLRIKKAFISIRILDSPINGAIPTKAFSFQRAFIHISAKK